MVTSYTGQFVQRISNGQIIDVKVENDRGVGLTLTEQEYRDRGIKPDIELLPDVNEYTKQQGGK